MLKRIVMWRLKDSAQERPKKDNARILKDMLGKLPEKIPVIEHYKVAININEDPAAADIVLISFFANRQAYEHYFKHPEHEKIIKFTDSISNDQWFIEYED